MLKSKDVLFLCKPFILRLSWEFIVKRMLIKKRVGVGNKVIMF